MPLTLVPPRTGLSPNWRMRGTVTAGDRSKYIDKSTGVADRATADTIRIQTEARVLEELVYGARASRKFVEAAVNYLEVRKPGQRQHDAIIGYHRQDGSVAPNLVDAIGDMLVNDIDQNTVDQLIARRFRGASPATVVRAVITPLTAVLNFAALRKWCDRPAFERPEFDDRRTRWLERDEAERLIAAAQHLRPLIIFLLLTGTRIGEALRLEWGDVDLGERWLVLRNTKRKKRGTDKPGEDRGVPIHHQLRMILANLPANRGGRAGAVFRTPNDQPYRIPVRQGGGQIKTAWALTLARAGIEDLHVHDLRHSFATWLRQAGVAERLQDEIMGHTSDRMGRRYAHVPRPELLSAIDRLPALRLPHGDIMPLRRSAGRRARPV